MTPNPDLDAPAHSHVQNYQEIIVLNIVDCDCTATYSEVQGVYTK